MCKINYNKTNYDGTKYTHDVIDHGLVTAINSGIIITKDDNIPTLNNHHVVASVNTPIQNSFLFNIFFIFFINKFFITIHTSLFVFVTHGIINSRVFPTFWTLTIKFFFVYFNRHVHL